MITPKRKLLWLSVLRWVIKKHWTNWFRLTYVSLFLLLKQYQHQGLSLSDLINEGNLGLIKAAQRFDETKGFKFISYAVMVDSPIYPAGIGRTG